MKNYWVLAAVCLNLASCSRKVEEPAKPLPEFVDRAADLGVEFQHQSGASGGLFMPETTGSGVALFDYDGDGDLDIYLVQGGWLDKPSNVEDRLFRNDLAATGEWRFEDVTLASGISARRYGQGIAIGDANNDGWLDIFLANFGADELWINSGDGTFIDQTTEAGLGDEGWATSAVFFDFDRDGWQDLFVTRYLVWSVASHKDCRFQTGLLDYCKPASYTPTVDILYRNLGEGHYEKFAEPAFGSLRTNGLGVVAADLNEDRWLDLYVANDQLANVLWLNESGSGFHDDALLAGVAVNREGMAEASMGVVAEDLDNDGLVDLFMTHLDGETNTLFRNRGDGLFDDETKTVGLATASLPRTAFGVGALDYDLDSWMDLVMATGGVHVDIAQHEAGEVLPLLQSDQFYRNDRGRFSELSAEMGDDFLTLSVGRGLAIGDLDNDGDDDVVINNAQGLARILINQRNQGADWIGLAARKPAGRSVSEGTRVTLGPAEAPSRTRWIRRGSSYLSSGDARVRFGLAGQVTPQTVTVDWLDGRSGRGERVPAGSYFLVEPGTEDSQ